MVLGLLLAACGGEDPVVTAATAICDAIDAEASDEVAFAEFERSVARARRGGMAEVDVLAAVDERCGRAVAAIRSAALAAEEPEPEPELEPEPEPEPELVEIIDLRDVDWPEVRWSTGCTEDGLVRRVGLTASPWDEPGVYVHPADADSETSSGVVYSVTITEVVYGDVTGDGLDNAAFIAECFIGNDYLYAVEVWGHDEAGRLRQLPTVITYSKWDGRIDAVEVADQQLRIHTSEPAAGEEAPHLNGYAVEMVTDWAHGDGGWDGTLVSAVDTTPPPPAPAPPTPAPPAGPTACEQLGFPDMDEEWCAQTLADIEQCYRELDADPNWVPYLDSLYENLETGAITACDI